LTALVLFAAVIFFIVPSIFSTEQNNLLANSEDDKKTFYLNENYSEDDPLLTIIPDLEDMITGPIITDVDPAIGSAEAKINIVAYTDFECSYCYSAINEVKKYNKKCRKLLNLFTKTSLLIINLNLLSKQQLLDDALMNKIILGNGG